MVDGDRGHVVIVELLMLIVAEQHDRIERGRRAQHLTERLDGLLHRTKTRREDAGFQLRIEIGRSAVGTDIIGAAQVLPMLPSRIHLRAMRGGHPEDDLSH